MLYTFDEIVAEFGNDLIDDVFDIVEEDDVFGKGFSM